MTTARILIGLAPVLSMSGLLVAALLSVAALAQERDCPALRARIEAAGGGADASRLDLAIRQQRAELDRVRTIEDDTGCGRSLFDDPDPPACGPLIARERQLRDGIAGLEAQAARDGGDEDRRAAIEDYNASCTGGPGTDAALPTPDTLVPVDPDAPAGPAAPTGRFARVLCVRHCDGAYYPLAVDVPADKLDGLDQLCQAQCPNAESSAYTGGADDDIGKAQAADGSSYAALPSAFLFQKTTSPTCACRAPGESWAQTLAKADTMIDTHTGDVTVTPEIQARMSRALPPPSSAAAAKATPARKVRQSPARSPAPAASNPGLDLTREFRRSVPTL